MSRSASSIDTDQEGFNDFPAALDQTATAGRSWAATYLAGDVPANPPLPGDEQWGTIDSFGFPGNWIIRGSGSGLFTVGGNLTGLATGATVVLQNNGADNLPLNANGPFTFATPQADASGYNVTVLTPPPTQLCTVSNGSGTVMAGNVTNIGLNCINAAATAVPVNGPAALAILFAALAFLALYRLRRQSA